MNGEWSGRRVLITGLSGFIGSRLAHRLLSEGAHVSGIVRNLNSNYDLVPDGCNVVVGDVSDYSLVAEAISSNEVDAVFHFAACAIVRISARDPMTAYRTNVMGTVSVLEAIRNVGRVRSVVVASSDKAYGDHDELPYTEKHPLQPSNTYDTSKACMDLVARSYGHNYGMPVVVSRCSNVYGPGDGNLSRIIPNTVMRALSGLNPVLYEDVARMEREFVYIDDVVEAYMLLGQLAENARGAYNVGGTGPVGINDLVKKITEKVGKPDLEPEIVKRDASFREIERQYIDAEKFSSATGWSPKVDLDEGLERTVSWYREFFLGASK